MTLVALVLAAVSLLVALVCLAAMVEMHRNLQHLQEYVEYDDTPQVVRDATAVIQGSPPSSFGLPPSLDSGDSAILVLSPKCRSCIALAEKLAKGIPPRLAVVVTGADEMTSRQWLKEIGLSVESVTLDRDYQLADRMSLYSTPSALRITEGELVGAWSIPSYRALQSFLKGEKATASSQNLQPQKENGAAYAKTG